MLQSQNKENALFEYTNKILSIQRAQFIEAFPRNIHQLLAIYLQFCYYICAVPYRLVYNQTTLQYETRSNIIQQIIYTILWTCSLVEFMGVIGKHISEIKPGDPLSILMILGGLGHLSHFSTYLFTTVYYRDDIKNLINYFLSHSSPLNGNPDSNTFSLYKTITTTDKMGTIHSTILPANKLGEIGSTLHKVFTFKRIAIVWWFMTLGAGIICTGIVGKIYNGTPLINTVKSEFVSYLNTSLVPNIDAILTSSSLSSRFLHVFLNFILICAYMDEFSAVFIYALEIMIALTMKCVSSHFTTSLMSTRDYWKPSSNNVLSSLIVIRQGYRTVNKIFGWLLFYSIMGEFPNFTFSVVFRYMRPDSSIHWPYKFALTYVIMLLAIASLTVNELSSLKDWMYFEDKRLWSSSEGDSLQRRIILFELSLNRFALYAHGLFQLSLPAFISIASGILSNALIIFQLAMSNNNNNNNG